jgi:N-acylneuraminate cytidylyltransferase/CMP-N,N'-diacetyllegionaminic acid synthase
MINDKKVLAIIPARGGSKGLPKKNIMELNGKPLIAWTIEQALATVEIDTVVVTTDSNEILNISKQYGAEAPFIRPDELATDTATSFSAIEHCIDFYKNKLNKEFDIIVLLEPTSPLREVDDLSNMLKLFDEQYARCNAVISVGEVSEHPSIVKKIDSDGFLNSLLIETENVTRRQDNSVVYFPYCVAYMVKRKILIETKSFYPKNSLSYKIKRHQCYEVDDLYDFLAVENIMKFEKGI